MVAQAQTIMHQLQMQMQTRRPLQVQVQVQVQGPVRKAPSNLFTIWVFHSTAIYFLYNCF